MSPRSEPVLGPGEATVTIHAKRFAGMKQVSDDLVLVSMVVAEPVAGALVAAVDALNAEDAA